MRTIDEVRTRYNDKDRQRHDVLGFGSEVLGVHLPEGWKAGHEERHKDFPLTDAFVREQAVSYLGFAFEKALDHRGISAGRSVMKLREYAWLLGLDGAVAFADDDDNYGDVRRACPQAHGIGAWRRDSAVDRQLEGRRTVPPGLRERVRTMTDRVGTIAIAALGGDKITAQHVKVMTAIARGENPTIVPMMRRKLVIEMKLLRPVGPPRAARVEAARLRTPSPRRHELTDIGRAVLAEIGVAA